jgi:hypothetical protein
MESGRLQREQIKSNPDLGKSKKLRASNNAGFRRPLTLGDERPSLRLDHTPGTSYNYLPYPLQAKLTINKPGDQYEQEADRVAEQVMRMPDQPTRLQRKCACGGSTASAEPCEACSTSRLLQRHATIPTSSMSVEPAIIHDVLRSPGQPLDITTRAFMERRFGYDFHHVKVHTNDQAAQSARAVHALAYTVGHNIVFGSGEYAPMTQKGQRLLAHELSHTIQQAGGLRKSLDRRELSSSGNRVEAEDDSMERKVVEKQPIAQNQSTMIARQANGAGTTCVPGAGRTNSNCTAYFLNSGWLPIAYVNNATCACLSTPNVPTANCVRKFLQDRMAATPSWLKLLAASQKPLELNPMTHSAYQAFVQTFLTPRIYQDHVDAYRNCCCPSGPAPYPAWIGVTTIPLQPCSLVGLTIRYFGSCSGTPGTW